MNGTENTDQISGRISPKRIQDLATSGKRLAGKRTANIQDRLSAGTILFVGENAETLLLGKRCLEKSGVLVVETVRSGISAIEKFCCKKYDGILSNYSLGDMNGIVLLRHIRANIGAVPFILFTDEISRDVVTEAFENGADFCVRMEKGGLLKQYLLLEKMFGTLIELSRAQEKLRVLQNQKTLFTGLSGASEQSSLLLLNTPTGCLGRTLNGGLFFYGRKSGEGDNRFGYAEFIARHNGELTRISNRLAQLRKQRSRLASKGWQTCPDRVHAIKRTSYLFKNVPHDPGKCGRNHKECMALGEYLNAI